MRGDEPQVQRVTPPAGGEIWGEYAVSNPASGRSCRVSLRGWERGESFCECPDFRKNTLGTCKHIMRVLDHAKKKCRRKNAVAAWEKFSAAIAGALKF